MARYGRITDYRASPILLLLLLLLAGQKIGTVRAGRRIRPNDSVAWLIEGRRVIRANIAWNRSMQLN
jgi:hypothetical protein